MADTASNVQFKVENGLLVVGSANFQSSAVVNGAFTVGNITGLGNTTITGFANVSSTLNVNGAATFNGSLSVNNALSVNTSLMTTINTTVGGILSVTSTLAAGNTTVTGFANISSTLAAGNTTVTGFANISSTLAAGNTTVTGTHVLQGISKSFNASSNVNSGTDTFTINAHGFSNGDLVKYIVAAGNTAISGLSNNFDYYVITTTSNTFQISSTFGGANINVTSGLDQTGHSFTPLRIILDNTTGNISTSLGLANVASIRSLGNAVVNGALTVSNVISVGNTTITGSANITTTITVGGNATFDTDLLFLDAVNNRIGIKNTAPSSEGVLTIAGNIVFTVANTTGLRFFTSNATHNAAVTLIGNTTNTRLTFSTFDSSNSSVKNGGFIFYGVNSSASQSLLSFSNSEFLYKTGNVTHAGIFGIYDVNGTRVGP